MDSRRGRVCTTACASTCPEGFDFTIAEIGSSSGSSRGDIAFELNDSYGEFARLHMNNHGPIREEPR